MAYNTTIAFTTECNTNEIADSYRSTPDNSLEQRIKAIFLISCDAESSCCIESHIIALSELEKCVLRSQPSEEVISMITASYNNFIDHLLEIIASDKNGLLLQQYSSKNKTVLFQRHIALINQFITQQMQKGRPMQYYFDWTHKANDLVLNCLYGDGQHSIQSHGVDTCARLKVIFKLSTFVRNIKRDFLSIFNSFIEANH